MERQKLLKVSVEVRSGTARFGVGVKARSTRKALSIVGGGYRHGEVRVVYPLEPEGFVVRDAPALARIVGSEQAHTEAA